MVGCGDMDLFLCVDFVDESCGLCGGISWVMD